MAVTMGEFGGVAQLAEQLFCEQKVMWVRIPSLPQLTLRILMVKCHVCKTCCCRFDSDPKLKQRNKNKRNENETKI